MDTMRLKNMLWGSVPSNGDLDLRVTSMGEFLGLWSPTIAYSSRVISGLVRNIAVLRFKVYLQLSALEGDRSSPKWSIRFLGFFTDFEPLARILKSQLWDFS